MIGRTLGPYEIVARIGAGGMGEVYRARDPRLGRDVAVKVVAADAHASGPLDAWLLNEARQASALSHAHICHIYDVGETEGRTWVAMELVPGPTLADRIALGGLPADSVVRIGRQICSALAHAHDHGIIHRDLKAANIVLTHGGDAKYWTSAWRRGSVRRNCTTSRARRAAWATRILWRVRCRTWRPSCCAEGTQLRAATSGRSACSSMRWCAGGARSRAARGSNCRPPS